MQAVEHKKARRERGQALVEMAITLPLLLLLLMGIMEMGWYFYNQMSVENGSREGARYAIVHAEDATLTADVTSLVQGMVVGPGTLTVTLNKSGNDISVAVTKAVPTLTPIAVIFTPGDTFLLSAKTTMKV